MRDINLSLRALLLARQNTETREARGDLLVPAFRAPALPRMRGGGRGWFSIAAFLRFRRARIASRMSSLRGVVGSAAGCGEVVYNACYIFLRWVVTGSESGLGWVRSTFMKRAGIRCGGAVEREERKMSSEAEEVRRA
jgi:hypothetical protein